MNVPKQRRGSASNPKNLLDLGDVFQILEWSERTDFKLPRGLVMSYATDLLDEFFSEQAASYEEFVSRVRELLTAEQERSNDASVAPESGQRRRRSRSISAPPGTDTPKRMKKEVEEKEALPPQRHHQWITEACMGYWKCEKCKDRLIFAKPLTRCEVCRATFHPKCIDENSQCPGPCARLRDAHKNPLVAHCPSRPPYVPALIEACVQELEKRGLRQHHLYRTTVPDKVVQEMVQNFTLNGTVPNLSKIDPHVLASVIKKFLDSLSHNLIPTSAWVAFATAVQQYREAVRNAWTEKAIRDLPGANKHTLATLILHLKNVADNYSEIKMLPHSLGKVLGPTIVGYRYGDPDPDRTISETNMQNKACMGYWKCEKCKERLTFSKPLTRCEVCRATFHPKCIDENSQCPGPCARLRNANKNPLVAHCPSRPPYVPALIEACVQELEKRGLRQHHLYRTPVFDEVVPEMVQNFTRNGTVPNLSKIDVNVLASVIKNFLDSLSHNLIPTSAWDAFATAVSQNGEAVRNAWTEKAIRDLPGANKHTLATLILHLKNVADNYSEIKMLPHSLGKVLGRTIVGYRNGDPDPDRIISEKNIQNR
ncbi:unnamed protein product, partial [Cyprideis torosa]